MSRVTIHYAELRPEKTPRRHRLRTAAVVGLVVLLLGVPSLRWIANHTGQVSVVNHTLASAREALKGEVHVDQVDRAEAELFACCGASGPSGSFEGTMDVTGRDAARRAAERVAAALRRAGWRTWDGLGPDQPLRPQDGHTMQFDAAPASALEAGDGGRGVEVFVDLLDATDAQLMQRQVGDLVVQVRTWGHVVYQPG
jgi:hypothetical protein